MEVLDTSFDDLGLSEELLKAVGDAGYEHPTPIQEKAIPNVLMGRDLLGCAQTGTGKTASYALPIIDILGSGLTKVRMPRALILAPTRELAQQIAGNFETYGKYHGLHYALLIGGEPIPDQERALERGPDVAIATPGRLLDLFERGSVMFNGIKILVIDEADRMFDMGFIPDVKRIVSLLPKIRQTLLFSATLDREIKALADAFLINPKEVSVAPSATVAQTVEHSMVKAGRMDKRTVLRRLLVEDDVQSALIFCNRKRDIGVLAESLRRHGFKAGALHGDLPQYKRTETLAAFKAGEINLLVSSDVAGRGLDIENVSHVFNFDVPVNPEDYVHRIGRTGRAGRAGRAITLVAPEDAKLVRAIVRLIGVKVRFDRADGENETQDQPAGEPAHQARRGGHKESDGRAASRGKRGRGKGRREAPAADQAGRDTARRGRRARPQEEETGDVSAHLPDFLLTPVFPRGPKGAE